MPGWDDLYEDPSSLWYRAMLRPIHEVTLRWCDRLRAQGARRVYDMGCGLGRHTVWLAEQGLEVVATDTSPRAVEATRQTLAKRGLSARVELADMRSIPLADASCDGVLAIGVLEHGLRRDMEQAVGETRRVLRPGGRLLASFVPRGRWISKDEPDMLEDNTRACYGPEQEPHHFVDEAELRDLFAAFEIEGIEMAREAFEEITCAELFLSAIKPPA